MPACDDGSTRGDCCKQGPHVLVSKTGYAKKLEAFCGPAAPKFSKSDFEKGKARWLIVFNRTGSDGAGDTEPELEVESPTIGYRSEFRKQEKKNVPCYKCILESAAYDQLHYGECGEFRILILYTVTVCLLFILLFKFVVSRRTRDRKKIHLPMEEPEEEKERLSES